MAVYTVTKTIGTSSRNYSTLALWEADAPANLTTAEKSACTTFLTGTFTVGMALTFVGSGATGVLLETDSTGPSSGTYMVYGITTGNPAASDVITGTGGSPPTCVLTSGTADNVGVIWEGQAYNDSTFTALVLVSGSTSSSTCYKKLTVASGQSFVDTPSNALRYNSSNGVTLAFASGYATACFLNESYARLTRFQIQTTHTNELTLKCGGSNSLAEQCILAGNPSNSGYSLSVVVLNDATILRNCYVEKQNTNSTAGGIRANRSTMVNCTVVNISGSAVSTGIILGYSGASCIVRNCAVFGFATATNSVGGTAETNYTDNTSPGSGWTGGIAFSTATFANVTAGSWDLKLVSGSGLLDVGTTDATHGTPDIFGTARPSGSAYDIGCWEYVSAGVAFIAKMLKPITQHISASNW